MTTLRGSCAGRRVLVVEDHAAIALSVAAALEEEGAVVVGPVGTAESAMRVLAGKERIDAAVLDVKLTDGAVFPVADELLRRNIPFVFTTAYAAGSMPDRYARIRVLEKPFAADLVARAIYAGYRSGDAPAS